MGFIEYKVQLFFSLDKTVSAGREIKKVDDPLFKNETLERCNV